MALEKLPECGEQIAKADCMGVFWADIWYAFEDAHSKPKNEDFVSRVYEYASWCMEESNDADIQKSALANFYEYLPVVEAVRKDMANHLTQDDFSGVKEAFKYFLSEKEYAQLEKEFLEKSTKRLEGALKKKRVKK
jgi:hypothetical protein